MFPQATHFKSYSKCQTWKIKSNSCPTVVFLWCGVVTTFLFFLDKRSVVDASRGSTVSSILTFVTRFAQTKHVFVVPVHPQQLFYTHFTGGLCFACLRCFCRTPPLWCFTLNQLMPSSGYGKLRPKLSHVSELLPPLQYVLQLCKLCASRFLLCLLSKLFHISLHTNRNARPRPIQPCKCRSFFMSASSSFIQLINQAVN